MKQHNEETIKSWQNFMDLRLPLSVELGRAKLKIREILELEPSSVIKLSRSTGEGVEICSDNQPLVRGEIIAIEDRAGVRINEIVKEEE
ncbi:MAG: FliM/FliN family flagellar motor switch protein [Pyrinomonadaceae bacterium]|nr:FliM/FliN family flagellar motor switch protein [Pyrinomonadaceae bacterium]